MTPLFLLLVAGWSLNSSAPEPIAPTPPGLHLAQAAPRRPTPPAKGRAPEVDKKPRKSAALRASVVLTRPWGTTEGQVGRLEPEEGAAEGPMSFFVTKQGAVYILDQVNSRIQVWRGEQLEQVIPLPAPTFQDLAVDGQGRIFVLDRLARRSVELLARDGRVLSRVALQGPGIAEPGGITAMFLRDDGVWVELEHGRAVRVCDPEGKPDPTRPEVPGRFSGDGVQLLTATMNKHDGVAIWTRHASTPRAPTRKLASIDFERAPARLFALESDPAGRIYLGAQVWTGVGSDKPIATDTIVAIARGGRPLGRIELSGADGALEQFRVVRVGGDGLLYHLHCGTAGVTLRRVEP